MVNLHQDGSAERLANLVTGDVTTLFRSAIADNEGPLVFTSRLAANAAGSPLHRRERLHERFLVTDGRLLMTVGAKGHVRSLSPGDSIDIPPGMLHAFRNALPGPTEVHITVTPGAGFERFLRAMIGLARDGRTRADGLPRDFRLLLLLLDHADMAFAGPFAGAQRRTIGALAGGLRRLGFETKPLPYWTGMQRADAA